MWLCNLHQRANHIEPCKPLKKSIWHYPFSDFSLLITSKPKAMSNDYKCAISSPADMSIVDACTDWQQWRCLSYQWRGARAPSARRRNCGATVQRPKRTRRYSTRQKATCARPSCSGVPPLYRRSGVCAVSEGECATRRLPTLGVVVACVWASERPKQQSKRIVREWYPTRTFHHRASPGSSRLRESISARAPASNRVRGEEGERERVSKRAT